MKRILGYSGFHSAYTDWGIKHEPAAKRKYQIVTGRKSADCGLFVNPKFPYLGSSPDGLVGDDGVLEVKCPASQAWRNSTPSDCCDDPNFYCALNEKGDPTLKKTHKYYYQFQGQMAISSRKWCDFVVWTLKGINIERIEFDEDFWNEIAVKLDKFYLQAVLPELFSSRVKRGLSLFPM